MKKWVAGNAKIAFCFRYRLERLLETGGGRTTTFIMLNPSTADADKDDPTIRRCLGFAERWGSVKLVVVNLFAYRATNPKELSSTPDPIGNPQNDSEILAAAEEAKDSGGEIVCAWGTNGKLAMRDVIVTRMLQRQGYETMCLALADGMPRHPLYLSGDLKPVRFEGRSPWPTSLGNAVIE